MSKKLIIQQSDFLLYTDPDGEVKINVLLQNETIWLNAHQMSELFGIDRSGIIKHIKNIYETANYNQIQPVQKLHRLLEMAKKEPWIFTILM